MFVAIHGRKAIYMIGAILHDRLTNSRFEMQNLFADHVLAVFAQFGIEDLLVDFMDAPAETPARYYEPGGAGWLGEGLRRVVTHSDPAEMVYFVSKEDLAEQVERLGYGKGLFIPMCREKEPIDAFGWVRVGGKPRLVGFVMAWTTKRPISRSELCQVNEHVRIIKAAPPAVRASCSLVTHKLVCW